MRSDYVRHQRDLDACDYAQLDLPSQTLGMALWYFSKTRFSTLARCIDIGPP